jgi:N4-gp56 family major capsid protein
MDSRPAKGARPEVWDDEFFTEYVQDNKFASYMGTDENSIIQVKEDLKAKKGTKVNFNLVNRLTGGMITGSQVLEGNEERMDTRNDKVEVDKRRCGVRMSEMDEQAAAIDLRAAGRSVLMTRTMEDTRDLVIDALGSVWYNGQVLKYSAASEAAKDAWLVANADRVLFGASKSNGSSLDHSTALGNIDNTSDKLTSNALKLMKRMALQANPKIKPIRISKDKRFYVVAAGTRTFRDLSNDSTIAAAQRETISVKHNNFLWEGGDLYYDGLIIKEVDDIPVYTGVGNGGIDVSPVYLMGAQAVGVAWAKRWRSRTKEFDYGDKYGIAMDGIYGVKKLFFGTGVDEDEEDPSSAKQHGVLTGYFAAVDDA